MYDELSLNGTWDLRDDGLALLPAQPLAFTAAADGWIPQPVPGDIHQGLITAGKIPEPLLGVNTRQCLWTENRAWWFRTTFAAKAAWQDAEIVELEMNGLDMNAEIYLNGIHLGSHRNAFRPFACDLKPHLASGQNVLLVRLTHGVEDVSELDIDAPDGVRCGTEAFNGRPERGDSRRVMVRKPQYSWGWDWSPRCATTAIAGDVIIRAMSGAVIRNVALRPLHHDETEAWVRAVVTVERFHYYTTADGTVRVTLTDARGRRATAEASVVLRSGLNFVEILVPVRDPQLWWPNGLGAQHRYQVETTLTIGKEKQTHPAFPWGMRFLELDTTGVFAVKVNGQRVFCRGGNYVPADAIYARTSDERYETLVREARDANFTMLRVWGGGWYEREAFYEACDRYGILLWHDFMFACAPYPDHLEWFRQEVEKEADFQTRRLQRHACIAVWSGSNENNWGFRDWWKEKTHGGAYAYNYILPQAVQRNCPEIPYWNGSPYGGDAPNCEEVGDRHHWGDCTMNPDMQKRITPEEYDKCNSLFVSEFGYIGAPCRETIETYMAGTSLERQGDAWQHHTNTFEKGTVDAGIRKHYVDPENLSLDDYILYSGLTQGLMYAYSLESMRYRANCHGSLIWMYADCWGEVGWTVIDYYLRRKISWWFVRRTFAPLRLILRPAGGDRIRAVLANDTQDDVNLELECGYLRLDGKGSDLRLCAAQAPAGARTTVCEFRKGKHDPLAGLWLVRVRNRDDILPGVFRAADFRQLQTTPATPKVVAGRNRAQEPIVTVSSDVFAHAVQLTLPAGAVPEDNCFDLLPGESRTIRVSGVKRLAAGAVRVTCVNHS